MTSIQKMQGITKAEASYEVAKRILEAYCAKIGFKIEKYRNTLYIPSEGEYSDQNVIFLITDPYIKGYPKIFVTINRLEHCFDDRDYFTKQIAKVIKTIAWNRKSIIKY